MTSQGSSSYSILGNLKFTLLPCVVPAQKAPCDSPSPPLFSLAFKALLIQVSLCPSSHVPTSLSHTHTHNSPPISMFSCPLNTPQSFQPWMLCSSHFLHQEPHILPLFYLDPSHSPRLVPIRETPPIHSRLKGALLPLDSCCFFFLN